jgi:hypothetical protein
MGEQSGAEALTWLDVTVDDVVVVHELQHLQCRRHGKGCACEGHAQD